MKKQKLIGALVAILGPIIAVSTAFALYVSKPEDKVIDIGINTTADVNLSLSGVTTVGTALSPDEDMLYQVTAGGNLNGSAYTQPVVIGKLTVKIKTQHATLLDNIEASVDMGYIEGSHLKDNWTPVFGEKTVEGSYNVITASGVVAVEIVGREVSINLALLDTVTDTYFIENLNDANYSIEIDFAANGFDFDYAYILGSMPDSNWAEADKYRMVPLINGGADFEWVYYGFSAAAGTEIKCKKYDANNDIDIWSKNNGGNLVINADVSGDVYWKDTADNPIGFTW